MVTDVALLRLLQLVSPALPIGMYSYSQGMESAVADGWIANSEDVSSWLLGIMKNSMLHVDLPVLARLYMAWEKDTTEQLYFWCATLVACRETYELRLEDRQCGQSLARLLVDMGYPEMRIWSRDSRTTLAAMFSFLSLKWGISQRQALLGYLWSWLENQVLCAVKLVPLGQVAGQRLLFALADEIPGLIDKALYLSEDEIGGSAFSLALASSRHEMQYSRLFRS